MVAIHTAQKAVHVVALHVVTGKKILWHELQEHLLPNIPEVEVEKQGIVDQTDIVAQTDLPLYLRLYLQQNCFKEMA